MRKALIVGINYYETYSPLFGCVDDAHSVKAILERHGTDGTINFDCKLLTGTGQTDQVTKRELKDALLEFFSTEAEIALFYFAGHGYIEVTGGFIVTSDASRGDEGVSLDAILKMANESPATNKVIVLDSCHSGIAGNPSSNDKYASLATGLTVLTASDKDQYASERDGKGLFTSLFVDALSGAGANLTGDITPGSIYGHIDQSIGAHEQRPVFKTNVKQFISLRKVTPPISISDLRRIKDLFPTPGFEFYLDPTFESEMKGRDPGMPDPIPENTQIFSVLQKYNRLNLLVPLGVPNMWNAAMESKSCKLTVLGEHYRTLAEKGRI